MFIYFIIIFFLSWLETKDNPEQKHKKIGTTFYLQQSTERSDTGKWTRLFNERPHLYIRVN